MKAANVYKKIVFLCDSKIDECNPVTYWMIKNKLKKSVNKNFDEILQLVEDSSQETMMFIVEILGEIGNKKAIPVIKKCINKQDLWGRTILNIGIALIKLNDDEGAKYLKEKIRDIKSHRDLRINSAKALIKFRQKGIFGREEHIDVTGESMTDIWSINLSKLIDCLRA